MDGRAFLDVASELAIGTTEAHWRAAVGRAYYALFHEGLAALLRWSFLLPPRENGHTFVRLRYSFAADSTLKQIGDALDRLSRWRNQADYHLATPGRFALASTAPEAVARARDAIALLDGIDADPSSRATAIAAIQAAFP